jgi:hypothetical protein
MTTSKGSSSAFCVPLSDASQKGGGFGGVHAIPRAALMVMDLRQPLQVIITAHDVLAQSGGADPAELSLIKGAVFRLAAMLDRLVVELTERAVIQAAMAESRGNFTEVARKLARGCHRGQIPSHP